MLRIQKQKQGNQFLRKPMGLIKNHLMEIVAFPLKKAGSVICKSIFVPVGAQTGWRWETALPYRGGKGAPGQRLPPMGEAVAAGG